MWSCMLTIWFNFSLLKAGKNLGADLASLRLGVREPGCLVCCTWDGDSGTDVGSDRDKGSEGRVLDRGLNTSAFGDSDTCGTVWKSEALIALSISVRDLGRDASKASFLEWNWSWLMISTLFQEEVSSIWKFDENKTWATGSYMGTSSTIKQILVKLLPSTGCNVKSRPGNWICMPKRAWPTHFRKKTCTTKFKSIFLQVNIISTVFIVWTFVCRPEITWPTNFTAGRPVKQDIMIFVQQGLRLTFHKYEEQRRKCLTFLLR
jgi:hypothetical protein